MKRLTLIFGFLIFFSKIFGQEIKDFPLEKAFYSRENNDCENKISVLNPNGLPLKYSLIIKDGNQIKQYFKYSSNSDINFNFTIPTGLIEYQFQLFKFNNNDSTLVKSASNILCGDTYVIYGQSNGSAFSGVEYISSANYNDKWLRNLNLNTSNIYTWYNILQPYGNVGVTGLSFSKLIADSLSIPVLVINGSIGGQNIPLLSYRNTTNPKDVSTFYGNLLSRVLAYNSIKKIKGFLLISGESEAFGNSAEMAQFPKKFDFLYQNIKTDYPPIEKFIVLQTNLLDVGSLGNAGQVRDLMTKLMDTYENVQTLALAGITPHYSGIHYSKEGYEQIAYMIFKYFKNNVYSKNVDISFQSPRLLKAVKDFSLNRLRLKFDESQKVYLPIGVNGVQVYRQTTGSIFIDDVNYRVNEIENFQNEIRFGMNNLASAQNITYLPSFYVDQYANHYDGPVITNQHGFPALTFYQFPIGVLLETPQILSDVIEGNKISIQFANSNNCNNCKLKVFRKLPNQTQFQFLKNISFPSEVLTDYIPQEFSNNADIKYKFYVEDDLSFSNELTYSANVCTQKYVSQTTDLNYFFRGKSLIILKSLGNNNYKLMSNGSIQILPGFIPIKGQTISVQIKDCKQ